MEAIKAKAGLPKPTSSSSSLAGGTSVGTSVRIKPAAAAEASGDDVESKEERQARRRSLSHNSTLVVQADGRQGFIKSTTSTPSADTSGPKRSISALETSNTSTPSSSLAASSSAPVKTPSSSGSASPATSSPPVSGSSSPSTSPPSSFTFGDQRRAAAASTSFSSSPTGSKLGQSARFVPPAAPGLCADNLPCLPAYPPACVCVVRVSRRACRAEEDRGSSVR